MKRQDVLIMYNDGGTFSVQGAKQIQFGMRCVQIDWEEDGEIKQMIVPLRNVNYIRNNIMEIPD